jgi:hypothetical protein
MAMLGQSMLLDGFETTLKRCADLPFSMKLGLQAQQGGGGYRCAVGAVST